MELDNKVSEQINDIKKENLEKLVQLFPSIIKDGQVDFKALKEELGDIEEVKEERYEFTWAGKQNAKKKVQEDVGTKTLKYIEEDSKNPDTTENLYIEGDNLEVLKLLRQNYYGSIKMIYIDPPYNTGKDFVYKDNFSQDGIESDIQEGSRDEDGNRLVINNKSSNRYHANWLNMMYPRLKVARDLLTDDGVIFISIDDNEQENLKRICNEVFGEENFISTLVWQKKFSRANDATYFSTTHDYILCYCKFNINMNVNGWKIGLLPREEEIPNGYSNPDNDLRGPWTSVVLSAKSGSESLVYEIETPSGRKVLPPSGRFWCCNKETFEKWKKEGRIWFGNNGDGTPRKKTFLSEVQNGLRPNTILLYSEVGHNQEGKQETKFLFNGIGVFDGPKPVKLLKILMTIANLKQDSIVLDFFSGSATTAHAVMQLNTEDGGNRKYIMVQLPEEVDEKSEAYKFLKENNKPTNICEIGKERIRRAGELIKKEIEESNNQLKLGEEPKKVPDIGFKVFRTADTNINWKKIREVSKDNVMKFDAPDMLDFTLGFNDKDVVYEVLLRQRDLPLSEKLETLTDIGNRTYLYADSYLVCLETEITEELIEKLAELNPLPIKFIFRDSAFGSKIGLKEETFRRLKTLVERNSGLTKKAYTVEFI